MRYSGGSSETMSPKISTYSISDEEYRVTNPGRRSLMRSLIQTYLLLSTSFQASTHYQVDK